VRVTVRGADETVDRRLGEQLFEPLLQIARNSIAHGIELPEARTALGKDPVAQVTLGARRVGSRIVVSIADDGAGVDVDAIRERSVSSGNVTASLAQAADDNTLLGLLFLPGFSTRQSSDLLAGRGIGLDIALVSVQRLGGTIRLSSRQGRGFEATVEVPIESGFARVLWVTAREREHALLADAARLVRVNEGERVAHLGACLDARPNQPSRYVVELDLGDAEALVIGVDAVREAEEVLLRPLTSIVRGLGPYAGAVVRSDGSLALAIDPFALAPRARALGRIPEGRTSDYPLSRPPPPSPGR
jgi:two-component system chemotaxis sensor kinase CheA